MPQTKGFVPSTPYQDEYTPVESSGIYEEYADQQQLMQQRSASSQRPKKSKIFGRKNEKAKNKAANASAEPTEEPSWPPVAQEDSAVWNMPAEPYAAPAAAPYEPPMAQVQYPPQTAAQAPAYVPAQETYPQPAPQEMPPWEAPTPAVQEAPQPKPHVEEETPITRRLRAMQQSEPVEVVSASAPQPVRELQQPQALVDGGNARGRTGGAALRSPAGATLAGAVSSGRRSDNLGNHARAGASAEPFSAHGGMGAGAEAAAAA